MKKPTRKINMPPGEDTRLARILAQIRAEKRSRK